MAIVNWECGTCCKPVEMIVSQHVDRTHLLWNGSYRCTHCCAEVTFDDDGLPPEDIRKAILAASGGWELLVDSERDSVRIAMCLIDAYGKTRENAIQLRRMFPGPVAEGTKAEMHWLKNVLAKNSYDSRVVQKIATAATNDVAEGKR